MRHVMTFFAMLGLFLAGTLWSVHLPSSLMMLGLCMIVAGILFAAAETHGFEGRYVAAKTPPYRWETLFLDTVRLALDKGKVAGKEAVYVLTDKGTVPITGLFAARINHEMSIVLDTSEPIDHAHEFNRLKQGVM
jgi:hypothetical protein